MLKMTHIYVQSRSSSSLTLSLPLTRWLNNRLMLTVSFVQTSAFQENGHAPETLCLGGFDESTGSSRSKWVALHVIRSSKRLLEPPTHLWFTLLHLHPDLIMLYIFLPPEDSCFCQYVVLSSERFWNPAGGKCRKQGG